MENNNFNSNQQYGGQPNTQFYQTVNGNPQQKKSKTGLIVGITCGVLAVLAIGVVAIIAIVLFCVAMPKEAISSSEFKTHMQGKGYYIKDATYQFNDIDYIENVYLAIDKDYEYQIEFYEFSENSDAEAFFTRNKNKFELDESDIAKKDEVNGSNHHRYSLTTPYSYKLVSVIDNTAVYINTDEDNKDEIVEIVEEINY